VAAIATSDNLDVGDAQAVGMLCAAQAQIALNQGDLDAARQVALEGLDTMTGSENAVDVVSIVTLAALALQIEADRAQYARARRDPIGEQEALESARTVAARTLALRARAAAVAHRTEVTRAHRALCDAELARAEGRSDPDMWQRAATAGAEGNPHRTAYARHREAEAVLATAGDPSRAIDALTAAHATANKLGAQPLRREIEALARRARIELSD
jgi:ribosomal protein L16/L10AE